MGIQLISATTKEPITELTNLKFDNSSGEKSIFKLTDNNESASIDFEFPLKIDPRNIPNPNPARVFIFKNSIFRTNDIFELRIEKEAAIRSDGNPSPSGHIGYIFSLDALLDENILENAPRFFEIYAYAAIDLVLKNSNKVSLVPKELEEGYNEEAFRNLYDDSNIIFMAINENLLSKKLEFKIENYLCDLFKYGFYLAKMHDLVITFNCSELIQENYGKAVKNQKVISIKQSSPLINLSLPQSYYHTIIDKVIYQDNEPLTQFIMLYQVIELLKDKVLKKAVEKLLLNSYDSGYKLREKVNELKDGELIRQLFSNNYGDVKTDIKDLLKSKITSLLSQKISTSVVSQTKFPKLIYELRNSLLHNFSDFPQGITFEKLKEINDDFEYCIVELIATYKEPK